MKLQVSSQTLCDLLYDKELMDDVINAHLNILSRNFVRYGNPPKIWVLNSVVQAEFQKKVHGTKKEKNLMFADIPRFIDSLSRSSRSILGELNANVLNESRYILMPLNTKFHWFLLVLDTVTSKFMHMNSLWSPQTKGFVKIFAKFISSYIKNSLRYPAPKAQVDDRYSRQQSGVVDCGVFVCLWVEAFTQDDPEFWGYVRMLVVFTNIVHTWLPPFWPMNMGSFTI
ncbi:uncharacterized protein LOC142504538 [Primulina tabacum]|uniref:uncharacterized protein LOC142504538 n=1 Tax=Primulina tabacum TaxID=48773 RepID=UPI003F59640C